MCGITGVFGLDGRPVDRDVLMAMTLTLTHRGPDGHGVDLFADGSAALGLGHTRLKIIDLSDAANQPMVSDDGAVWVTFNGEIYNFGEERARLQALGVRFRTRSDTEVLLRLYEAEGPACLKRLDGMFAFALWDRRRRTLLLARDRTGKKPLFYWSAPGLFAFASEVKALLKHPDVPGEVDAGALPDLFYWGYVPTPATLYRGIRKLPPGHFLEVDGAGRVRVEEYWDVPCPAEPRVVGRAEAAATVRELVRRAVRRRLIADVPLGAFLSGGLDSSIVVGLMSEAMREPVRTFSIGFTGDAHFDETRYAKLAAERFGTRHTEFRVEPSAIELIEALVWHHDGPFADSSAVPTYLLSRLTREHVTVALNGDGGDEVFAGYLRFVGALMAERVPAPLRALAGALFGRLPEWGKHRSAFRRLQRGAAGAALPFAERFSRWISVFHEDLPRLVPDVARRAGGGGPLATLERHLARCRHATPLTQLLYLNLKTYLLDDLNVKMDRCSMAHGLETRSPFLDRELMEYVFTLPDALKLRRGRTKVVLRDAFADMLPREILGRGKMGFGVPLRAWFARDLRDYVADHLLTPEARLRDWVDQGYVRRLVTEHVRGRADNSHRLWLLLTFEVWLRRLGTWKRAEGMVMT